MRDGRSPLGSVLLAAGIVAVAAPAGAGTFDPRGVFAFDETAVVTLDFRSFVPSGDGGSEEASVRTDVAALAGGVVLRVQLGGEGYPIPLAMPARTGSYRLRYWLAGDCTGGAAVDYDDGSPGTVSEAFPTGRVTSDGWIEMETQPFSVDGARAGVDARLFLAAYSADQPAAVRVDAVEVVPDGGFEADESCSGTDPSGACGAGRMCLEGTCRNARGWFPPLPDEGERGRLVEYWKGKIRDTFGPYALRRSTMPEALSTLDSARGASNNVEYWMRFAEAIRRLRDAHTYARMPALRDLGRRRPLDACFFEGVADASQTAAASQAGLPDVLVSHTGAGDTWGLARGDRLVSVDGEHPLTWARGLMAVSPWYWEADDPDQIANVLALLRGAIARHASSIEVVRCDATGGTCDATTTTLDLSSMGSGVSDASTELVGCDNRPFFSVSGAPEDHDFGDGFVTPAKIVAGPVIDATPEEDVYGVIWNTLLGDGRHMPVDVALQDAVSQFRESRGVLLDHREGHGGTAATADILVRFARTPYTPFVTVGRTRAGDEGPADAAAGVALFERYRTADDEFGSSDAHTEIPVALLTTWDVSASDYLSKILKGGAEVRLFGPGPTMGAFGTFAQYSLWGVMLWSLGIEDAIAPDGTTLCTHGVDPDEVVVPRQTDLLAGRDTLHEAAMAWLRRELAP